MATRAWIHTTALFVSAWLVGCGSAPLEAQPSAAADAGAPTPPAPGPASLGDLLPSPAAAGVRFRTTPVDVPADRTCLNAEAGGGFARELLNGMERVVVVHGGERPIPAAVWPDFAPEPPWVRNQDLHSRFARHCVYRSPAADPACIGAACAHPRTVGSYSWNEIAGLLAQVCLPLGTGRCEGLAPAPGSFALTVLNKCQTFELDGDLFVASDGAGNRHVIHATQTPTPRLDADLPAGWTLERVPAERPLEVRPVGSGDACRHVVAFDHLGQLYTQITFSDDVFPPGAPADDWRPVAGAQAPALLTERAVEWPGQGRQTWTADGQTTVPFGTGRWKIEGDAYCSQFPGQAWRCFSVALSPDRGRLRVTGAGDIAWVGAFAD